LQRAESGAAGRFRKIRPTRIAGGVFGMARKLIDQDEAARLLGVTREEINRLRDRKELFPYRDGETWKFKLEDVERLAAERRSSGEMSWDSGSGIEDIPLELTDDLDSILLSEVELGESSPTSSSTIIGPKSPSEPSQESDIRLASGTEKAKAEGSDVELVPESGIGSDVRLVAGLSDVGLSDTRKGADVLAEQPKKGGSSDVLGGKGKPGGESDLGLGSGDLLLSDDDQLELLEDPDALTESDTRKGVSDIHLADESELVVGGSKPDSDITVSAADSGISLVDPTDSGLSLEEPLELGGSGGELLELGEDDVISLEGDVDLEGATQLKADDDFLLTPLEEAASDETDSGSQVIALDAEEDFSSGMFAPLEGGGVAMLEEEAVPAGGPLAGVGAAATLAATPALMTSAQVPEAPYTVWNVVSLFCCAVFLILGGMMVYDLLIHIWSWDQPYTVNSSIMDSLAASVGWFDK
jgi:excisionase family DNA binding protein